MPTLEPYFYALLESTFIPVSIWFGGALFSVLLAGDPEANFGGTIAWIILFSGLSVALSGMTG